MLPSTTEELIARCLAGESFRYLLFWGHTAKDRTTPGKACLSQWYPSPFTVDGERFATAEHWMMAGKARLFGDEEARSEVFVSDDPGRAKAIGRKVRGFDDDVWKAERLGIVIEGSRHKFAQCEVAGAFLASTAGQVLVEAAPRDRIWGIGMGAKNPNATHPPAWRGHNLLGVALMAVRDA